MERRVSLGLENHFNSFLGHENVNVTGKTRKDKKGKIGLYAGYIVCGEVC